MMRLKIALAQIYPKIGDVATNLTKHLAYIERAIDAGADLVVFPELSLTGYQVRDLVTDVAISPTRDHSVYAALLAASAKIDIVFGFVHEDRRGRYYIANAYLSRGETLHIHHKVYLPTYGMFDEGRYFAAGDAIRAFDTPYGRVGMLICEDFWHLSSAYVLWMDGADLMILNSASPARGLDSEDRLSSTRWVELVNQSYGEMLTSFVVHCNRVGYEDGKHFGGGSSVVDPNGAVLAKADYFDEQLTVQTIDLNLLHRVRSGLPLLRDERVALVQRELARILAKAEDAR